MNPEVINALIPALENVLDVLALKALFLDALFAGYSGELNIGLLPEVP